jgi:putative FmdB family regulatory protein
MPIYEYQCGQCGHRLESFEKITDAPLTQCPVCGKPTLQKLISAAGFHLKGTGWYATDFRNKGKPTDTTSKKENAAPDTKSDTKSVDTKTGSDTQTKDTAVT